MNARERPSSGFPCDKAHLDIAALWINQARGITNRTATTPAKALAIVPRAYRAEELLARRQDWGPLSPTVS